MALSIIWVFIYKWVAVPTTFLMISRSRGEIEIKRKWVPIEKISKKMQLAAICAEDARYLEHFGFDFNAIKGALKNNIQGGKKIGGSTISQQTAKNVFLWEGRSWLRKLIEAWFTLLIEIIWGKERIMEVYLNVIETGKNVFGVEAAAQYYYGTTAEKLNSYRSAQIMSIVPSPRKWTFGSYISRYRTSAIQAQMRYWPNHWTY